jgi:hypothetical protein
LYLFFGSVTRVCPNAASGIAIIVHIRASAAKFLLKLIFFIFPPKIRLSLPKDLQFIKFSPAMNLKESKRLSDERL